MLEMWEDQDKEEDKVTPRYLNSVTNSKGEPERQRGGSIYLERIPLSPVSLVTKVKLYIYSLTY